MKQFSIRDLSRGELSKALSELPFEITNHNIVVAVVKLPGYEKIPTSPAPKPIPSTFGAPPKEVPPPVPTVNPAIAGTNPGFGKSVEEFLAPKKKYGLCNWLGCKTMGDLEEGTVYGVYDDMLGDYQKKQGWLCAKHYAQSKSYK